MAVKKNIFPVTHHYELIDAVAEKLSTESKKISKAEVWRFYHALTDTIVEQANSGHTVMLPGVEKIELVSVPEHEGVKPSTGEKITVPAHVTAKIRPLSKIYAVKDNVKAPEAE